MADAYIVEALRTAGGRARKGGLVDVHPADLGATVLDALVARTGVDPAAVEDVIVGCVTQGGEQAFAFGRNLVLASSLPDSVPAVTIDRQCGTRQAMSKVKALEEGGSITAANASQMTDGASGAMIVSEAALKRFNLTPLARVVNLTVTDGDPVIMLEEPIPATRKALARAGMKLEEIDLFEVNEAFASIPMAWLKALGGDPAKLNVHGGAIALGHPLGA